MLVVTIIVLVILTAATVATISGENGVIDEARAAASYTKRQNAEDKVYMEMAALQIKAAKELKTVYEYLDDTTNGATRELELEGKLGGEVTLNEPTNQITCVIDGYTIVLDASGNIISKTGNSQTPQEYTFSIPYDMAVYYQDHLENSGSTIADPLAGLYKIAAPTSRTYTYEPNMTWRDWVDSEYNTDGYKIVNANDGVEDYGFKGYCIVTSNSNGEAGKQLVVPVITVLFGDSACTTIVSDAKRDQFYAGCGKIFVTDSYLLDLDEKISVTLSKLGKWDNENIRSYIDGAWERDYIAPNIAFSDYDFD